MTKIYCRKAVTFSMITWYAWLCWWLMPNCKNNNQYACTFCEKFRFKVKLICKQRSVIDCVCYLTVPTEDISMTPDSSPEWVQLSRNSYYNTITTSITVKKQLLQYHNYMYHCQEQLLQYHNYKYHCQGTVTIIP